MLFFFAGYEIDIARIRGEPLRLALYGWAMSLAIAYTLGGVLAAAGVVVSLVYVGSALATTAIGTLLPVLSDTGEMRTRFGTYLLAAGAVGEFGPILLLTLVLSTQSALHNALILIAFVALAVAVARGRGPLVAPHDSAVREDDREELAARGPLDRRARVRAGAARLRPRPRPAARRVRRRPDHAAGPAEAGGARLRLEADRRRVRGVHPVLLRRERHAPRRRRAVRERRPASRSSRCSSCSSSSSAERRRCCSTAACFRCGRTAWRSPCSPPRSCRSSWRSRPSPSTAGTCAPRPPPPSSAPERCRRSPARSTGCGCGGSRR